MERVGGCWLLTRSVSYQDDESVLKWEEEHLGSHAKVEDPEKRYGERWYEELVSNYQTLRVG
jgi:3'-phosphoadenosine 5'-phosphosulfate sulfotransferase (PAPS reductase)/FAD synthetase